MTKNFTNPQDGAKFGAELRSQNLNPMVRVNPPTDEVVREIPDSSAAMAELIQFSAKGDSLAERALAWAKSSQYWENDSALAHTVECLSADLDDGTAYGAASLAQAELFVRRLTAALARAPKIKQVLCPAKPQSWDIEWTPAETGETGSGWGRHADD
jgi:hypothetical protein